MINQMHIVVGLVFNEKNDILIALRPPHVVQPGIWEFPGGKVEENETLENALIREFHEEIGITITRTEFFLKIEKQYIEKNVLLILHVFRVLEFDGAAHGRENQEIRWVPIHTLNQFRFPDANAEIIRTLNLTAG